MAYEKPEYTIVGEAVDLVLGPFERVGGDDDDDRTSTDTPQPLGLED